MITINEHYLKLSSSYLFSRIAKIVEETQQTNPTREIIKLGIGDVTKALAPALIDAFHAGVDEMAKDETFKGYGPEQGYAFLRELIAQKDFKDKNIDIAPEEIIISDGSKCDVGNFQEIFSKDISIALPDPIYPVYIDSNVMAGRTGNYSDGHYAGIHYLSATQENGFIPELPQDKKIDLIYLCFPNNPTGITATKAQLKKYVDYALEHKSLILFDAAYCEYISDPTIPKSIYEIDGAKKCAVEFRSFSKTAGFTGTRCAYTVIPQDCKAYTKDSAEVSIREIWMRRHTTKFNGVSYPVQKAATAIYSQEGQTQIRERIAYYMENAKLISHTMRSLGFSVYGGINAPFIWVYVKKPSWDFFRDLLTQTGIVTTPGAGFGPSGEGYIRISAFNHLAQVEKAMEAIKSFDGLGI